jgi:hypothetical protein
MTEVGGGTPGAPDVRHTPLVVRRGAASFMVSPELAARMDIEMGQFDEVFGAQPY